MEVPGFFVTTPVDSLGDSENLPAQVKAVSQVPGWSDPKAMLPRFFCGLEKQHASTGWTHCAGYVYSDTDFAFAKHFKM